MSVRDVARETNMIPRYIDALENEDYTVFPGETYALGFLRAYADYLQLDTEHLINLYRGLQIDQSDTPLKELTKPTGGFIIPHVDKNVWLALGGVAIIAGIISLFAFDIVSLPSLPSGSTADSGLCKGREIRPVVVPRAGAAPKIESVSTQDSLKFSNLSDLNLKLCLIEVIRSENQPSVGVFGLRVNEQSDHKFQAREEQIVILGPETEGLKALKYKLHIVPRVLRDVSAQVQVAYEGDSQAGAGDLIRVTLKFTERSYIEWVVDGGFHSGQIAAGEERTLEAKNSLQIKLGNGGGVQVNYGNKSEVAGPSNRIVKYDYRRVPDPYDAGKFKIQVAKEVVK